MGNSVSFFSTCPACRHARLQNGYTRAELTASLHGSDGIDAYCLMCDVVWPISAQERVLIGTQLAGAPTGHVRVVATGSNACSGA